MNPFISQETIALRETKLKRSPLQDKFNKSGWDKLLETLDEVSYKIPPRKEIPISQGGWRKYSKTLEDKDYKEYGKYYFGNDTLTKEIKERIPEIKEANINKIKGDIAEALMDEYFPKNGWKKLEGEVGVNGIDGLYVKYDKEGNIKQVMVVESKYGSSQLGETKNGTQTSKQWCLAKIDELIKQNPDDTRYTQIKGKISNDDYRTRLFRVDEKDSTLTISIQKIESKDGTIQISEVDGKESYKINKIPQIDLKNPEGSFQKKTADIYERSKEEVIKQYQHNQQIQSPNQKETKWHN